MSLSFVSFRELRTSTRRINDMLSNDGKIIVTNKGKPAAIMLQVNETTLEDTLAMINQIRLSKVVNNMRLSAINNNTSEMSIEEINAEIKQSRLEKQKRLSVNNV